MKFGIYLRNMGPASTRATLIECARIAERAGIDDVWVADHIAIPPDQAEGSGGRYVDPLVTLAFLAGATETIGLGVGVLILPYRPKLPTAKWVASIQELSGNRLRLGVGAGWMEPEFRALGRDVRSRGKETDETLAFIHRAFAADEVEENGQPFLFLPRPERPPIYVGGASPAALRRAVRYGDGWMPTETNPEALRPLLARLDEESRRAGKPRPKIAVLGKLPLEDAGGAGERLAALEALGVERVIHAARYDTAGEFGAWVDRTSAFR